MTTQRDLHREARRLADLLSQSGRKIVFAESCTGGLVSASLTRIPGISAFHCGSAVVYQIATKQEWLGIPANLLEKPGPVSRIVAEQMATRVLERTPQADLAVSVTGHLGPNAPPQQDGLVFIGSAVRSCQSADGSAVGAFSVSAQRLKLPASTGNPAPSRLRIQRQMAVTEYVLRFAGKLAARSWNN